MLHKYGIENPSSGLKDKVIGYQFGQKIDVRDPHTMQKDKKPLKPFMVNNSVIVFEKEKIIFDPTDKILIEQFESYRIKSISTTGIPTYTDVNEHAVDALNLCLLIFEQKYGALFRNIITSKILSLNSFKREEQGIDRNSEFTSQKNPSVIIYSNKNNELNYSRNSSSFMGRITRNGRGAFTRSRF